MKAAKTLSFPFQLNQICYSPVARMRRFLGPRSSISSDFHGLRFVAYPLRRKVKAMIKRLIWIVTLLLLAIGTFVEAQQPKKIPRIGFLSLGSASSMTSRV